VTEAELERLYLDSDDLLPEVAQFIKALYLQSRVSVLDLILEDDS
jgi:hypothetical protein